MRRSRARASLGMVDRLRKEPEFSSVNNGEAAAGQRDREFLFQHRYLLSESVTAQRFTAAGLNAAIRDTIDNLASPGGLLFKSLLPRDPTGEMLNIIDQLARTPAPSSRDGVWVSSDGSAHWRLRKPRQAARIATLRAEPLMRFARHLPPRQPTRRKAPAACNYA